MWGGRSAEACRSDAGMRAAALDEAVKVFNNQGHSGCSAGLVMALVKRFSPVLGEEFVERVKI